MIHTFMTLKTNLVTRNFHAVGINFYDISAFDLKWRRKILKLITMND